MVREQVLSDVDEVLGEPTGDVFAKCYAYDRADVAIAAGIFPFYVPVTAETATTAVVRGRHVLMFGSNNYLGLTHDPRVRQAALDGIEQFGVACTGSRLLNGTLELHDEMERRIAAFMKRDKAVVFTTGFQANLGVISALVGPREYIIIDDSSHASIRDGARLSAAKTWRFRHNDMDELRKRLEAVPAGAGKLVVVDGIYSMEGDYARLPDIVELKRRYGARLLVDDAHAIGVAGANGRGTGEHFGVEAEVDLVTGTFSKALASIGGFVVGDEKVVSFIKMTSRPFLFSASPVPAAIAAALKALDIIESEPDLRVAVHANAERLRNGLRALGFHTGDSTSPIVPVGVGDDLRMCFFWNALLDEGLYTNAVIWPAVPHDGALIRMSCTAAHTFDQIDEALEIIGRVGRAHGII
jgi:8-amino-7-oxononanoate synthase